MSLIDRVALHRIAGVLLFLLVMYLLFGFAVSFGGYLQASLMEPIASLISFGCQKILFAFSSSEIINSVVIDGLVYGINTMLSFIPILMCAFIAVAFLEQSGYISRAEQVIHAVVSRFGLSGKTLITIIVGFGCNVPAVLNTKHLQNRQERIQAALMSPFMSCSARLAIYTVFTAAFFPVNGHNIIFGLYLLGIMVAIITGVMLRSNDQIQEKTIIKSNSLPKYQLPSLLMLIKFSWRRTLHFIYKAGKIIIPFCIIITCLNTITVNKTSSALEIAGKTITPVLQPLGVTSDNWQATVSLLTGVLAKEAVVGTLGSLYAEQHNSMEIALAEKFPSKAAAFAYLIFVLLYFPCISVITAIAKELNKKWASFAVIWTTGIAYIVASIFYQFATILEHPQSSAVWIVGLSTLFIIAIKIIRKIMNNATATLKFKQISTPVILG